MPEEDRERLSKEFLQQNVDLALKARRSHPWTAEVPWPTFLEYVLPYAR